MRIRDAVPEDAEQLDLLLTKLIRDEAGYDPNLNGECVVTDNYRHRIGSDGHKLIVAEENGVIVGYVYGYVYQIVGITTAPICVLDALYIDERYRRRGYATMLVSELKAFAEEKGACRMELKVLSENKGALELYGKLSFRETKKHMQTEI